MGKKDVAKHKKINGRGKVNMKHKLSSSMRGNREITYNKCYKRKINKAKVCCLILIIVLIVVLYIKVFSRIEITINVNVIGENDNQEEIIEPSNDKIEISEIVDIESLEVEDNIVTEEEVEVGETLEEENGEKVEVTSRSESTTRVSTKANNDDEEESKSNILTGYKVTSYYPGDSCGSSGTTGSGKKVSDFKTTTIEGKTVYTYQGKIVVATATNELLKTGYSSHNAQAKQDKHYFSYYDTFTMTINGNDYECIVLDSCGVSMWKGYYVVDIYTTNNKNVVNASNVTIEY